jgi:transcription termination factor Rho
VTVTTDVDTAQKPKQGGLSALKLAQLQELASQLGISGAKRMRKADLVSAISDHQRGGSVADRDAAKKAQAEKAEAKKQESKPAKAKQAKDASDSKQEDAAAEGAPKRTRRRRSASADAGSPQQDSAASAKETESPEKGNEQGSVKERAEAQAALRAEREQAIAHAADAGNPRRRRSRRNNSGAV